MVVTKTPSEPFHLVRKTLEGALAQTGYAHDTWLADEDPDAETIAWCGAHGVQISSRKGIADYHRREWPRRTRCKEGNLAYFYDQYGYDRYDFVSQFDADHVPAPDYLRHALAPFADPKVGYVSAPSICDSNADESWSARGRLYLEASMHGALQTGYNSGGLAPLCIGSHYTVRTAALRSIGGLGPELAEDHSTTLMMNAHGWTGVHAVDAIAHGQGPETFTDLVIQEFQWSRSLVTILLRYMPAYLGMLPSRLRSQFLFSELWYPIFSMMMALMFAMPIIALVTAERFVDVTYIAYFIHILPLSLAMLGLAYWWRSTGLFRPATAKILSWEGMAFLFLRWPWSLLGSLTAVLGSGNGIACRLPDHAQGRGSHRADPVQADRTLCPSRDPVGGERLACEGCGNAQAASTSSISSRPRSTRCSFCSCSFFMRAKIIARSCSMNWSGVTSMLSVVTIAALMTGAIYCERTEGPCRHEYRHHGLHADRDTVFAGRRGTTSFDYDPLPPEVAWLFSCRHEGGGQSRETGAPRSIAWKSAR